MADWILAGEPAAEPVSSTAPSPFPPIADYAFLSDCHTGALVAPDGSVDWLCVPGFDAPSVFGSLLDREAGSFRLGPYGINHPTARAYLPGTNVLETTWRTPSGWVVVRDALVVGAREDDDQVTPHTRPPIDQDAHHLLVRTVECFDGHVEVELVCEPAFDYGRTPARWQLVGGDRHVADATGAGQTIRLWTDLAMGVEGNRVRARRVLRAGDAAYAALSWSAHLQGPQDTAQRSSKWTPVATWATSHRRFPSGVDRGGRADHPGRDDRRDLVTDSRAEETPQIPD